MTTDIECQWTGSDLLTKHYSVMRRQLWLLQSCGLLVTPVVFLHQTNKDQHFNFNWLFDNSAVNFDSNGAACVGLMRIWLVNGNGKFRGVTNQADHNCVLRVYFIPHAGADKEIDVIDVSRQCDLKMRLGDFIEYYNSPNRDQVLNVISLEFSETRSAKWFQHISVYLYGLLSTTVTFSSSV